MAALPSKINSDDAERRLKRIFDRSAALARFGDDEAGLRSAVDTFLEDVPEQMRSLRNALHAGDAGVFELVGESLMGASGTVGSTTLEELGARLNTLGDDANVLAEAPDLLDELQRAFDEFRTAADIEDASDSSAGEAYRGKSSKHPRISQEKF